MLESVNTLTSLTNTVTSLASYARRRGVSRAAVTKAVQEGRLRRCVIEHHGRPAISDPELADQEWQENTRSTPSVTSQLEAAGQSSIAVSRARYEEARAQGAELDLQERLGELVRADRVRAAVADRFLAVKAKLLAVPARVRQQMPHIAAEDIRQLDELIREALEDLANGISGERK
jgi:hypothetical protein